MNIDQRPCYINLLKLTLSQYAFLNWLEDCKKKGVNVLHLKGRGRI